MNEEKNIILPENEFENKKHKTLFGFTTENQFASKSLDFIYIIVMIVATCFAFHALSLILNDWNKGLIFLASLSVVGLPYCIKIIMYGRERFEYKHAVLCIVISLLPTIFDFVGFYSETSIKSALQTTKFEVLEKVNYFDKEVRKSISKQLLALENETNSQATQIEQQFVSDQKNLFNSVNEISKDVEQHFNSQIKAFQEKINAAEQAFIDETQGVRGKSTTGVAGVGPRAVELEAEIRKAKAEVELAKKELEANKNKEIESNKTTIELKLKELETNKDKEIEKLQKEYQIKKVQLEQGIQAIDGLVTVNEGEEGLVFKVNRAKTFEELADVSIELNSAINIASSKLNVEPQFIKFTTDNVINLSFSALLRGDITALVCFMLALLLEIVDTIIVYVVRGTNSRNKFQEKERNIRETIKYS